MANAPMSVSNILDQLATTSSRPRYAFAVLALLAEQAGPTGKTGPFITDEDEEKLPLREYIGKRLARMSGRDSRRRQPESRIREDPKDVLPEDMFEAQRNGDERPEEDPSELPPLMRISYAVFCLHKNNNIINMDN